MRFFPLVSTFLLVAATAEAGSSVKALGKQFRKLDTNHDQSLTSDEFAKVLPSKLIKNNALADTQAAMFAWFDDDANEGIDLSEWIDGETASGADCPDFTDEVQDELDANGDGKLVWKEFSRVIPKYVSAKTARGWFDGITSSSSSGASLSLGLSASSPVTSISGASLSISTNWAAESAISAQGWLVAAEQNRPEELDVRRTGLAALLAARNLQSNTRDSATLTGLTFVDNGFLIVDASNTYTGSAWVSDGSLSIINVGSLDSSSQPYPYLLVGPASDPSVPSVDDDGAPVSE